MWQRGWVAMRTQQGAATRAYGAIDRALTQAGQGAGTGAATRTGNGAGTGTGTGNGAGTGTGTGNGAGTGTGTCRPPGRTAPADHAPGDMHLSPGDVNLAPGDVSSPSSSPPVIGRFASLPSRHASPSKRLGAVTQRVRSAASFDRLGAGARLARQQRKQALHLPPGPNPNPNPN